MNELNINKIYIHNAGLVLLWPFLTHFFKNVGFIDERKIIDESRAEQACLLLQYLATGNLDEIIEAQLPLNKLLSNISITQPINTQLPISENHINLAMQFLSAVTQHGGEGWKNLSVDGLRQGYLQREGILIAGDGNWLLRVKRETYDVLTDRLPWNMQAVKLPWMNKLISVEWQQA